MNTNQRNRSVIYLISGPLGVGKSTTSKELARKVGPCVLIEGDMLLHMLKNELPLSWEEKLRLTWDNIVALTRNVIRSQINVVIDFVVEDEFEWFCEQIADLDVDLKYMILLANQETIIERLTIRGDLDSLERSLFLMNKMEQSPHVNRFGYHTTGSRPTETADEIVMNTRYDVELNPL
ncbi:AAA family ATPase [Paenibacillus sp. CF384]|uniref:AAA family ATPase n=1 Tax=Paenibacillus sp. CF384 TaxID=1884382 RepID=UPI000896D3E7|nr:AAA family ATPase [Paenibacillus sp. CF384]SDW21441.1 AAA domain-containing protein [Paenibacillus sp. CF384]